MSPQKYTSNLAGKRKHKQPGRAEVYRRMCQHHVPQSAAYIAALIAERQLLADWERGPGVADQESRCDADGRVAHWTDAHWQLWQRINYLGISWQLLYSTGYHCAHLSLPCMVKIIYFGYLVQLSTINAQLYYYQMDINIGVGSTAGLQLTTLLRNRG